MMFKTDQAAKFFSFFITHCHLMKLFVILCYFMKWKYLTHRAVCWNIFESDIRAIGERWKIRTAPADERYIEFLRWNWFLILFLSRLLLGVPFHLFHKGGNEEFCIRTDWFLCIWSPNNTYRNFLEFSVLHSDSKKFDRIFWDVLFILSRYPKKILWESRSFCYPLKIK